MATSQCQNPAESLASQESTGSLVTQGLCGSLHFQESCNHREPGAKDATWGHRSHLGLPEAARANMHQGEKGPGFPGACWKLISILQLLGETGRSTMK